MNTRNFSFNNFKQQMLTPNLFDYSASPYMNDKVSAINIEGAICCSELTDSLMSGIISNY